MSRFTGFVGGLVGSYALLEAPLDGTFLASLNMIVDLVGVVGIVVFSGVLIYHGVRDLFTRNF